ncbi:sulfite exporter TauE/SafE family protein [Thermoleophilum album]|uniref:sulfite exporter TauE/SafE family protein n=1 Tax=Thermoleophilum album TaxID=29539 RepID=UPI00237CD56B|nr:sulfite exporter TauE/SafE family protein [Thermoleophilum album]WDT93412.1 sulfite exporter TauE/SafE family protein [Thermoleophilum album]
MAGALGAVVVGVPAVTLVIGLTTGLVVGATGAGGSVLALPLLVHVAGQDPHTAAVTALGLVAAAAAVALPAHLRAHRVCPRHGVALGVPVVAAAVGGALVGRALPPRVVALGIAGALVVGAVIVWRGVGGSGLGKALPSEVCPPVRPLAALVSAAIVGALAGAFGVGGGFIALPLLVALHRLPEHAAAGTAALVVGLGAGAALCTHLVAGEPAPLKAWAGLMPGVLLGVLMGARVCGALSQVALRRGTALLLAAVAVPMALAG